MRNVQSGRQMFSRAIRSLFAAALFSLLPASPAHAVTMHYIGTSDATLQVNLSSYAPGNSFQVNRGTKAGAAGSIDVFLDTDLNTLSIVGYFASPGSYWINTGDPGQTDTLKGMIGNTLSFSASKQLYNYSYNTADGWFGLVGGKDDATISSTGGILGSGADLHATQSLNNIATYGTYSSPVLYGSFATILNNIGVEVLLGVPLIYQGIAECELPLRPTVAAQTAVPEPSSACALLCGLFAVFARRRSKNPS